MLSLFIFLPQPSSATASVPGGSAGRIPYPPTLPAIEISGELSGERPATVFPGRTMAGPNSSDPAFTPVNPSPDPPPRLSSPFPLLPLTVRRFRLILPGRCRRN